MTVLSARLSEPALTATPGGVVACDVRMRNGGDAAMSVRVEARGRAGTWAVARPEKVAVAPGAEASARLTFTVPDSTLLAGETFGFTVRLIGDRPLDVPGTIEIAERRDVRLSVHPLISQDRREGRHTVLVANRGNVPALVTLGAEADVAVHLASRVVVVEAGTEARVDLAVSAGRSWFGRRARPHRVVVRAEREDGPAVEAAAMFFQSPVRWKGPLALAATGLLLAALAVSGFAGRDGTEAPGPVARGEPVATAVPSNCPEPAPVADGGALVPIRLFVFCPVVLTVPAGTEVRWRNEDAAAHTATFEAFDTGVLRQGQSAAIRFDVAGTYSYYCVLHPGMRGTVVVTA